MEDIRGGEERTDISDKLGGSPGEYWWSVAGEGCGQESVSSIQSHDGVLNIFYPDLL